MKNIIPHLWFDKEAKEAVTFYSSLFPNSTIYNTTTLNNTPSGDCDLVDFKLAGEKFMAISAGPYFKFNPSISFFVVFDNEKDIDEIWERLSKNGKEYIPYHSYPWAHKYGWIQDKFGLSWQLSWNKNNKIKKKSLLC